MNTQQTVQRYLDNDLLDRMLDEALYPESLKRWRLAESRRLHELVAEYPNARVIDFACGDGRHLESLRQAGLINRGLGIDIDPTAIEKAQSANGQNNPLNKPTIEFLAGSMDDPSLSSIFLDSHSELTGDVIKPVDVVYCLFSTLLATDDPGNAFNNMMRLLKPGGTAFLSVYAEASVPDRIRWYEAIGEGKLVSQDNGKLEFESGFTSGFVTKETAKKLFGDNIQIESCSDFGYIITQQAI